MSTTDDPNAPDDTAPNDDGSRPLHPPYDLKNLPHPTRLAILSEFSTKRLQQYIDISLQSYSKLLERPTTPDETNAIAYYCAKRFAIGSWGLAIGQAAGLYRGASTWKTYSFPFYKPDLKAWPWAPPYTAFGYPLNPLFVKVFWQITRVASYGTFGGWAGKMVATSYAIATTAAAQSLDERMEDIREAALRKAARPKLDTELGFKNRGQDPPLSNGEEEKDKPEEGLESGRQMLSDEELRKLQKMARPPYSNRGIRPTQKSTFESDKDAKPPRSFDEPSPPPADDSIAPEEEKPQSSGSAWERLRRNASNQSSSPSTSTWAERRGDRSATEDGETDSFGFDKGDEDQKKSKEDAQREFDEALERERRQR